ncbi:hypothetical protein MJU96_014945 [Clostridioides difficile]|nr:hypothetical protein [Clostridioides difficile]
MIKINRTKKPIELTEEVQKQLTEEFKNNKEKSVWRKKYITDALLEMSHGKCCYCEMKLIEEGKSINVEHFHHKDKYPDEVVEWENLLPSCGRCNSEKGTHDTKLEPIINPVRNNPKDYLYLYNYRYKSKNRNKLGSDTIDILYLNDTDKLIKPRVNICMALFKRLESIKIFVEDYQNGTGVHTRRKNKIINEVKGVLRCAQPTEEYSAIVANVIINDDDYKYIKEIMSEFNLWDKELEELENKAKETMLDSE